jgi:CTP synthase (UTP-ammonia lyase)
MKRIALLGEYEPTFPPHVATTEALRHSGEALGVDVEGTWLSTATISDSVFRHFDAILVTPGSPYKSMSRTLAAIRHAREYGIPCFGTCGGFQHMLLEYARNVLGFQDAEHAEYDPTASNLFISALACSLARRRMQLRFAPGSRVAAIYGTESAEEEYYCNFGVNPDKVSLLRRSALVISGSDAEGEIRVIELPDHPFFIGTLFVPQLRSTPAKPHPLVTAFVQAVVGFKARAALTQDAAAAAT